MTNEQIYTETGSSHYVVEGGSCAVDNTDDAKNARPNGANTKTSHVEQSHEKHYFVARLLPILPYCKHHQKVKDLKKVGAVVNQTIGISVDGVTKEIVSLL